MAGAAGGEFSGKFCETRAPEAPGCKKKGEGTSLPGCSFPPFMTLPEQRDRYW